jgi:hypothetical protein
MLLGAFACVCLVLQQCFVPLHLALNDHVLSNGQGGHVHSHVEHVSANAAHTHAGDHHHGAPHSHQAPDSDDSHGDHDPHPIDDHLTQLAEAAVVRTAAHVSLSLAPTPSWVLLRNLPGPRPLVDREQFSLPPSPRVAQAAPRAPPIAI